MQTRMRDLQCEALYKRKLEGNERQTTVHVENKNTKSKSRFYAMSGEKSDSGRLEERKRKE